MGGRGEEGGPFLGGLCWCFGRGDDVFVDAAGGAWDVEEEVVGVLGALAFRGGLEVG